MRALVLQHMAVEGPGSLASYLARRSWEVEVAALYAGAPLPDPRLYEAILVMGGPMGVYDEMDYPFLRAEHDFLIHAIAQRVPLLGICLGAQLLAKALGARVYRNPQKEIGWDTVELTVAGHADPLFSSVSSPVPVFQWHGDAFELPLGATSLAASPRCTHQAFRYSDRVYGLLFHLELRPDMIRQWLTTFQMELVSLREQIDPAQIVADIPVHFERYAQAGHQVFMNLIERLWEPMALGREPLLPNERAVAQARASSSED